MKFEELFEEIIRYQAKGLKEARISKGLTMKELADMSDIDRQRVFNIENARTKLSLVEAKKIWNVLKKYKEKKRWDRTEACIKCINKGLVNVEIADILGVTPQRVSQIRREM